jgi:hypothetical protein
MVFGPVVAGVPDFGAEHLAGGDGAGKNEAVAEAQSVDGKEVRR